MVRRSPVAVNRVHEGDAYGPATVIFTLTPGAASGGSARPSRAGTSPRRSYGMYRSADRPGVQRRLHCPRHVTEPYREDDRKTSRRRIAGSTCSPKVHDWRARRRVQRLWREAWAVRAVLLHSRGRRWRPPFPRRLPRDLGAIQAIAHGSLARLRRRRRPYQTARAEFIALLARPSALAPEVARLLGLDFPPAPTATRHRSPF